jgi:selenocysteine lyase/cysteine desulfurase
MADLVSEAPGRAPKFRNGCRRLPCVSSSTCRRRPRFSPLQSGFVFLDAPGGTQVPDEVGEAIARALREASGNLGAPYATSRAVEAILTRAKRDAGALLGCSPDEIVFGANMTSLNFNLTRNAGRDFAPGDEILVTRLDQTAALLLGWSWRPTAD